MVDETENLTLDRLTKAVADGAAIRRVRRLQPAGGPGDKIFPPTYPGETQNSPPRHVFETRRIDGHDVRCVLIDSVQSQANRLEEALLAAHRARRIKLPLVEVDFTGQKEHGEDLSDLGVITSLDAPHRIFDAILRDSETSGMSFMSGEEGQSLQKAKPRTATAVFQLSPSALLFGAWNSTGEGGGLGAKFARCIVSEVVGVGASDGKKAAVRVDPTGIRASVKVVGGPTDWRIADEGERGAKSPSEINHSNVLANAGKQADRVNVWNAGVTVDYALHTAVITLAGLRRLSFPLDSEREDEKREDEKRDGAARAVLGALGLVALTEQDRTGYALRSRCDLVPERQVPFELVRADGSTEPFGLDTGGAVDSSMLRCDRRGNTTCRGGANRSG